MDDLERSTQTRSGPPGHSRAGLAACLPQRRGHDLQHGCPSLVLAHVVPAQVVMEVLGQAQISMTMDTYSHVVPALRGDAAKAMNVTFQPA